MPTKELGELWAITELSTISPLEKIEFSVGTLLVYIHGPERWGGGDKRP